MFRVHGLFAVVLCYCFLGAAVAEDKKDAKINGSKIVGTWIVVKDAELPPGTPVEFTKDGKLILKFTANGKEIKLEAMYKVDGDKLTLTMKNPDGKDEVEVDVINVLTEDKLMLTDPKKKETELKRKTAK